MKFEITILGTSSAVPTSTRFPSAHVLNANEHFFLVDCGEGTQMQLRKFKIKFSKIDHIFITHLHGDHYLGLFGLLYSLDLQHRKKELNIYAPEELRRLVRANLKYADLSFPLKFHYLNFIKPKKILDTKTIEVFSFPLHHRIPTCGFFFKEKAREPNILKEKIFKYNLGIQEIVSLKRKQDILRLDGILIKWQECTSSSSTPRSYAYVSDTLFAPEIVKTFMNVDLLYHESTFMEKDKKLKSATMHSTAREAAQIASLAQADKLVIGHYSARYFDLQPMLVEAKTIFVNTFLAREGLTFEIPFRK